MKKVWEFITNGHIQVALGTGSCILIIAFYFKYRFQTKALSFEEAFPALVMVGYEYIHKKHKDSTKFWARPWFWNLMQFIMVGLVFLRREFFMG